MFRIVNPVNSQMCPKIKLSDLLTHVPTDKYKR